MVTAVMTVPVMIMTGVTDHTIDRTHRAADTRADRAAHHTADRPGCAIAAIRAFLRAADDALRMPGQRCGEQHQERQGRSPRKDPMRRLDGGCECFHFRLSC